MQSGPPPPVLFVFPPSALPSYFVDHEGRRLTFHEVELLHCAKRGNRKGVTSALQNGANIEVKTAEGYTALVLAAQNGNFDILTLLISRQAALDAQSNDGETALMLAAAQGNEKIVDLLIAVGASVDIQSCKGETALMFAAAKGHGTIVNKLMQRADVTLISAEGLSASRKAAQQGHLDIMLALRSGNNPSASILYGLAMELRILDEESKEAEISRCPSSAF